MVGGLRAGSGIAGLAGDSALSGTLGAAAGYIAAPLAVYNAVKNWQSGNTANDTIQGAEAGVTVGAAFGGIGAPVGALVGAGVGAISSAFGPGKMDVENTNWNSYAQAYDQQGGKSVAGATPSQNFQALAGIFDSRGSSMPFYQKYGRMGENQFTTDMFSQINSALKSGRLSPSADAGQIYSSVVEPWITSMGGKSGWQNTDTSKGFGEKQAVGNLLTNFINQWQAGMINSGTGLGVNGQTLKGGVPQYLGARMAFNPNVSSKATQAQSAEATGGSGSLFAGSGTKKTSQPVTSYAGPVI